jgi:hypothetical protein
MLLDRVGLLGAYLIGNLDGVTKGAALPDW